MAEGLNDKDRLEGYKFLSETHRRLHDERRKYEWRVVFETLTLYVLSVSTALSGKVKIPDSWCYKVGVGVFMVLLAVVVSWFLASLHEANDENKKRAKSAEDSIKGLLSSEEEKKKEEKKSDSELHIKWYNLFRGSKSGVWAWRGQVWIVFAFSIASALILTLKFITS